MSYAGPRGDEHYRLYEIPSHPVRPWERNKGERGGMEVEVGENRESEGIERHNKESQRGKKPGLPVL